MNYDVVIIGGGQAGLAMGHYLAKLGLDFVILDAGRATGETWRQRWDSLTLFTPARYSSLPGLPFPAEPEHLPVKDEVAAYLASYARHFSLPIRHGEKVRRLARLSGDGGGFVIDTEVNRYEAQQVVVATGPFHAPRIPAFAHALSDAVMQLHSSEYRSPSQLPDGDVVVIGAGNSGVQIAAEVAQTRTTSLAIGTALPTLPQQFLGRGLFWWLDTLGFMNVTVESRVGQKIRRRETLIGRSVQAISREDGVRIVGRAEAAETNRIRTADGRVLEPVAVIWATGYTHDFRWIDAPVFNASGAPIQRRGVTPVAGLYFLGLPWQHTRGSSLIGWVGRDAAHLAQDIARRANASVANKTL